MPKWFLGAYAGYASFTEKNKENDETYLQGLQDIPHIVGLELPFYSDLSDANSDKFIRTLPKHWDYILTLLPGTMQSIKIQPEFGLASKSSDGRKAAMSRMTLVHRRVHEINARCGLAAVRGIQLHSAPTKPYADVQGLYRSLEELQNWDWQGAQLFLEHCDRWHPERDCSKGFLDLNEEIGVLNQVQVRLSLNWGRSVLEQRNPEAALEHIRQGREHLAAFFFSGVSVDDPLYGSWQDNHVPFSVGSGFPWEPVQGLLNRQRVKAACEALTDIPDLIWGIKVQPAPASLTLKERLDFIAQQVMAFQSVRTGDCEA